MIIDNETVITLQYKDIWKVSHYGNEIYFYVKNNIFTRRQNSPPYPDDPQAIRGYSSEPEIFEKLLKTMSKYHDLK